MSEETTAPHPAVSASDAESVGDRPGEGDLTPAKSVERLFPFVVKARAFIVGRDILARSKSNLHFILITTDISDNSRDQILRDYTHYPVVQCYTEADLENFFAVKGTKIMGFTKSGLAQSIYAELKPHRINRPVESRREAPNSNIQPRKISGQASEKT